MSDDKIQMVDLTVQYHRLKDEIDRAIQSVTESGAFINGPQVGEFAAHLSAYLGARHVIPCANGTDALQIAMMRLNLRKGDEVIIPAFTYAAAAEAAILLGLTPVAADVDSRTFNLSADAVSEALSERTKAIVAVHLFGQSCDMHPLMETARRHSLYVIEDNAQSLGSVYTFPDGSMKKAGTMGHVGTLSFFPTKILGCYGDGGALTTGDETLAGQLRMSTVHGQSSKYHHRIIGCNSRLDTLQAALLDVKLRHVDAFIAARRRVASIYDRELGGIGGLTIPCRHPSSTHVYHQYTLQVEDGRRDSLLIWLRNAGIPSAVYYPLVMDEQPAFSPHLRTAGDLPEARRLTKSVISLPIHTEMTPSQISRITQRIVSFFK
ncbi:MAG: DegT/DnrJ/EryC1/StrS family aminotransferase [Tannerellaceae bacterium]|jgi:dTDP-4-amino-4,6-dideoxygalactose transaminase|nr:DegT/DnrJ/EryC1/StrS family aminotransferase [Tannerellaceae bacterium]